MSALLFVAAWLTIPRALVIGAAGVAAIVLRARQLQRARP